MQKGRVLALLGAAVFAGLGGVLLLQATYYWEPVKAMVVGRSTVADRVAAYGVAARARMAAGFAGADVAYPPAAVRLVALKEEGRLEVYAASGDGWAKVKTYEILAASGKSGPKLAEGDEQVPEGVYDIESLHPNSRFHLALRVGYPNERDRTWARQDGRERLGGDIMIHGKDVSAGCLAMGDAAIEELFVLVADVGREKCQVVIAPWDLRLRGRPSRGPVWAADLYEEVEREMPQLRSRATPGQARD